MASTLDTGIKNARNVPRYIFRAGALDYLESLLSQRQNNKCGYSVYFIDIFFKKEEKLLASLPASASDMIIYVDSKNEPTTTYIDNLKMQVVTSNNDFPHTIIGIGGGSTLDTAKAISNLLTNEGKAEAYQGWDLVKSPGVYKIGIPTISGTGSEATRTCVMINPANGLKLGMNSDHTVFDQLILDPDLSDSVPGEQFFYTGMDTYLHCVESLAGTYRNTIGDAFSNQAIALCREVFSSRDMKSAENRQKLMAASYLGGCAVGTSYVGVLHPVSAALSVVLGIHHCLANCITMTAMKPFYPQAFDQFLQMKEKQRIEIPTGICKNLTQDQWDRLYHATIIHEKPLTNALGENFKNKLTKEKIQEIFRAM